MALLLINMTANKHSFEKGASFYRFLGMAPFESSFTKIPKIVGKTIIHSKFRIRDATSNSIFSPETI